MTRDVLCCRLDDALKASWTLMKDREYLHIPVIAENRHPISTLHARDALQVRLQEVEHEEDLLQDDGMGIGYR